MIKLGLPEERYNELETRDYDYNDYLEDHVIRQEILEYLHDQELEDQEINDIINNEPGL